MEGWGSTRLALGATAVALCAAVPAAGQAGGAGEDAAGSGYQEAGGYDDGGGYDGGSDDYPDGGSGAGAGRVELSLTAKRKQKSLKAVKATAGCGPRACLVDATATLKAGKRRKARLKPVEDLAIAANREHGLRLKLTEKAAKTLRRAARRKVPTKVKVYASAKGVGGGGRDSARLTVRLKP